MSVKQLAHGHRCDALHASDHKVLYHNCYQHLEKHGLALLKPFEPAVEAQALPSVPEGSLLRGLGGDRY